MIQHIAKPILILFILLLTGCSTFHSGSPANWVGYKQSGKASFYADRFQKKKTASGEIYQHNLKTAAHREIPFGAVVKVTNKANGKSVLVKINDRGPFVRGRVIDLSKSAFASIGNPATGILEVKIQVVR